MEGNTGSDVKARERGGRRLSVGAAVPCGGRGLTPGRGDTEEETRETGGEMGTRGLVAVAS